MFFCANLDALSKGDLRHEESAFNGKEQKNRGFLLILWKPVLGVDDCTDFTSLIGYFLLAVWIMTV